MSNADEDIRMLKKWDVFRNLNEYYLRYTKLAHVLGDTGILVTTDDTVLAVGGNRNGCLGIGNMVPKSIVTKTKEVTALRGKRVTAFAGWDSSEPLEGRRWFALTELGVAYGWGDNACGQLGPVGRKKGNVLSPEVLVGLERMKVVQVACGRYHTLALTSDGEVYAYGLNTQGQVGMRNETHSPGKLAGDIAKEKQRIKAIACGESHSVALSDEGKVYFWGSTYGQNIFWTPTRLKVPTDTDTGSEYARIKKVVCGLNHSVALSEEGKIYSWGKNDPLISTGDGLTLNSKDPAGTETQVDIGKVLDIGAAGWTDLSVCHTQNNCYYTWRKPRMADLSLEVGSSVQDLFQRLSKPAEISYETLTLKSSDPDKKTIRILPQAQGQGDIASQVLSQPSPGCSQASGTWSQSSGICSGSGNRSSMDNGGGSTTSSPSCSGSQQWPGTWSGSLSQIENGNGSSIVSPAGCSQVPGTSSGTSGTSGSLVRVENVGPNNANSTTIPMTDLRQWKIFGLVQNNPLSNVKLAHVFGKIAIWVTTDDKVFSVGSDQFGSLGIGRLASSLTFDPVEVEALSGKGVIGFSGIESRKDVCRIYFALTFSGSVFGWGSNQYGQLGLGTTENTSVPTILQGLEWKKVIQVATGCGHTLLLTSDGQVYSFGRNDDGQLGNGSTKDQPRPVRISGQIADQRIVHISCGKSYSGAVTQNGLMFLWGSRFTDELEIVTSPMPGRIPNVYITKIASGLNCTMALTSNKKLYSWGKNHFGQLGIGNSGTSYVAQGPLEVPIAERVLDIALRPNGNFAVCQTATKVYVWGEVSGNSINYPMDISCPSIQSIQDAYRNYPIWICEGMYKSLEAVGARRPTIPDSPDIVVTLD